MYQNRKYRLEILNMFKPADAFQRQFDDLKRGINPPKGDIISLDATNKNSHDFVAVYQQKQDKTA